MVFSSVIFLYAFLPAILVLYFVTPRRGRNGLLLIGSLFFYTWGEQLLVFVMLTSTAVDYICGRIIYAQFDPADLVSGSLPERRTRTQKAALLSSIIVNILMLGIFKYFNFAIDNYNAFMTWSGLEHLAAYDMVRIAFPLGISFYTFQSMSYTIDVYRGQAPADRNFINFACYVTMFPQLIAGPIVRYTSVARELKQRHITVPGFADGVRQFIIGLGRKMLVANVLAEAVDAIFALPDGEITMSLAWVAMGLFALQLYYDFAGYSDMAIGMGKMFGFNFPPNFNYPFIAKTMSDFWRRWHMSLSTWLRDYVFEPIGGFWEGRARSCLNVMIVFVACGVWHGASWNFVIFGFTLGGCVVFEHLVRADRSRVFQSPLGHLYLVVVLLINLIVFRGENVGQSWVFFKAMLGFSGLSNPIYPTGLFMKPETMLIALAALLGCIPFIPWLQKSIDRAIESAGPSAGPAIEFVRQIAGTLILVAFLILSAMKLAVGTYNPFIYFRF
jgi:alginate O-acetyltransferase complex protein AlgI